jgi:hypothetical protein
MQVSSSGLSKAVELPRARSTGLDGNQWRSVEVTHGDRVGHLGRSTQPVGSPAPSRSEFTIMRLVVDVPAPSGPTVPVAVPTAVLRRGPR